MRMARFSSWKKKDGDGMENENKAIEQYLRLSKMADRLDEDNPAQLLDKLRIYGQMLDVVKDLATAAKNDYKRAYAERKRAYAEYYLRSATLQNPYTGKKYTAIERREYAEIKIKNYREMEANLEKEADKWKYTFEMLVEQINIMKYRAKNIRSVYDNSVY